MNLLILLSAGFISGLLSSIPPGPTNIWLIRSNLPPQRTRIEQFCFITGIILMDVLYALIALFGYYTILKGTIYSFLLLLVSAFVICAIGVNDLYNLTVKRNVQEHKPLIPRSPFESLMTGILFGINPAFIVYWLLTSRVLEESGFTEFTVLYGSIYGTGIILSDIIWYCLVLKISSLGTKRFSESLLFWIRLIVACFFIIFGAGMLWDINHIMD